MLRLLLTAAAALLLAPAALAGHAAFDYHPGFARTDPAQYETFANAHQGAGHASYMFLFTPARFSSDFIFLHRGVIHANSSLGLHRHENMEEIYVLLDPAPAFAWFTVTGNGTADGAATAELAGPALVPCPMGAAHGIYNPTDRDLEWMNIAVTSPGQGYDAVNLGDDLAMRGPMLLPDDAPPPLAWAAADPGLLRPVRGLYGGQGVVYLRELFCGAEFATTIAYVRHLLLPPGASVGGRRLQASEEIYYVLEGAGLGSLDNATYPVQAGDAVACVLGETARFVNDTQEPLQLLVFGISLDKGCTDPAAGQ
jgi:quercetin dioxygenase-like cupin family protein